VIAAARPAVSPPKTARSALMTEPLTFGPRPKMVGAGVPATRTAVTDSRGATITRRAEEALNEKGVLGTAIPRPAPNAATAEPERSESVYVAPVLTVIALGRLGATCIRGLSTWCAPAPVDAETATAAHTTAKLEPSLRRDRRGTTLLPPRLDPDGKRPRATRSTRARSRPRRM
jgi:hypothetical protein